MRNQIFPYLPLIPLERYPHKATEVLAIPDKKITKSYTRYFFTGNTVACEISVSHNGVVENTGFL